MTIDFLYHYLPRITIYLLLSIFEMPRFSRRHAALFFLPSFSFHVFTFTINNIDIIIIYADAFPFLPYALRRMDAFSLFSPMMIA